MNKLRFTLVSLVSLSRTRFSCLLLATLLMPWKAFSFEGWEHETVSAMSLVVASNYVALSRGQEGRMDDRWKIFQSTTGEFVGEILRGGKPSGVNYGIIAKLVDYMRDPYSMMHRSQTGSGWPTNAESCNLAYLETLSHDSASYIGASHANYDHFQGRALFSFWFWHKQAVSAAQTGNLWGALMLSAYANHFLEDSFAPGHLLAPRDDNAHDIYTLMLHDYYNKRGLTYCVQAPDQLADIARSMQLLVKTAPLSVKAHGKGSAAIELTLTSAAANAFASSLSNQAVQFQCFGDSRIKQNPQQLPLVVTFCARAISDVLESYLDLKTVNSFEKYRWECKFFPMKHKPRIEALDFELSFGRLTSVDHPRTLNTNDFLYKEISMAPDWIVSSLAPTNTLMANAGTPPVSTDTNKTPGLHPDLTLKPPAERLSYPITEQIGPDALHNTTLGVSLAVQSIQLWDRNDTAAHMRALWEAGGVVAGRRFDQIQDNWKVSTLLPNQFIVVLAYSGVADTAEQGHGGFARIVVPWPQVNLDISITAGGRYYFGSGLAGGFGDYESLRVEWGMHLTSLFFGVGHDHYPLRQNLADGLTTEAGVTIAFPLSRWKNFF